jgi:hypothetical protein
VSTNSSCEHGGELGIYQWTATAEEGRGRRSWVVMKK